MRLNRYLAQAGIASRRAADALIAAGRVTVDGEVVNDLGRRVEPGQRVGGTTRCDAGLGEVAVEAEAAHTGSLRGPSRG